MLAFDCVDKFTYPVLVLDEQGQALASSLARAAESQAQVRLV